MRRIFQAMLRPRWAVDVGLFGRPHDLGNISAYLGGATGLQDFMGWIGANFDPGISWQDLQWIRDEWKGNLVIKGILDEDDARDALAFGADGIVVSNHGGRQLDGALSTARALPSIADAVKGRMTVFVDGGVRTGTDVFRMLALGADGVLIGRAFVYALAAQGQAGVERLLAIMEKDIRTNMVLTGVKSLRDVGPDVLAGRSSRPAPTSGAAR
jgi:L-lactate dehydrogenase (cytochrome)